MEDSATLSEYAQRFDDLGGLDDGFAWALHPMVCNVSDRMERLIKSAHGTLYEQRHEINTMRELLRDCARALQHNLGMWAYKDEQVMYKALVAVWDEIGREYCECPRGYPNHDENDHAG